MYRLADDMNTPHEIISHWLVEQAVPGRQSMKMLKLRPLFPPTANTLDVPAVETVSLNERFKSVWEAHSFDPVSDELESTSRTASNGGLYDAHIRASPAGPRRGACRCPSGSCSTSCAGGKGTSPTPRHLPSCGLASLCIGDGFRGGISCAWRIVSCIRSCRCREFLYVPMAVLWAQYDV